jgi:hypothetical protein
MTEFLFPQTTGTRHDRHLIPKFDRAGSTIRPAFEAFYP